MVIQEITNCSRPVLFENDFTDYDYSIGGSCIVVSFRGVHYAITAKHVIKGYVAEQILIPYQAGSNHFLPISEVLLPNTCEDEDTDHKDFVLLRVAADKLDPSEPFGDIYEINFPSGLPVIQSDRILISGFPREINEIDYDTKKIKQQRFLITGTKLGKTDYLGMIKFQYDPQNKIKSFDGLSGAPIFLFSPIGDNKYIVRLEGILLRESYYLDFNVIYKSLLIVDRSI